MKSLVFTVGLWCFLLSGCQPSYETISLEELEKTVLTDSVRHAYEANPTDHDILLKVHNEEYMEVYLNGPGSSPNYQIYFENENDYNRVVNSVYYPYTRYMTSGNGILDYILLANIALILVHLFFLYDVLRSDYQSPIDKLIWFFMVFVPLVGPVYYVMLGRKKRVKQRADLSP